METNKSLENKTFQFRHVFVLMLCVCVSVSEDVVAFAVFTKKNDKNVLINDEQETG